MAMTPIFLRVLRVVRRSIWQGVWGVQCAVRMGSQLDMQAANDGGNVGVCAAMQKGVEQITARLLLQWIVGAARDGCIGIRRIRRGQQWCEQLPGAGG